MAQDWQDMRAVKRDGEQEPGEAGRPDRGHHTGQAGLRWEQPDGQEENVREVQTKYKRIHSHQLVPSQRWEDPAFQPGPS